MATRWPLSAPQPGRQTIMTMMVIKGKMYDVSFFMVRFL
jgi:hypothetical protein